MVCTINLDDRVIPHHPLEHRDTIHIKKKRYFPPLFYPKDIHSSNQAEAHIWQEAYIHLSKIPMPNPPVKGVLVTNLY